MKTVGIVGGIAPESTIVYYRLIIERYRAQTKDDSYPHILLNSIDLRKMLGLVGKGDRDGVVAYLSDEVRKLAKAGADFGLFASNTPHMVFEELQRLSPIPLISIVKTAAEAVHKLGLRNVGLFGTRFTMQGRFYPEVFSESGVSISLPDPEDLDYIHDRYMKELVNAVFLSETRERLLAIVDRMKERQGIEGLILGGTELPLILKEPAHNGIPLLDTCRIHVERIVSEIVGEGL